MAAARLQRAAWRVADLPSHVRAPVHSLALNQQIFIIQYSTLGNTNKTAPKTHNRKFDSLDINFYITLYNDFIVTNMFFLFS